MSDIALKVVKNEELADVWRADLSEFFKFKFAYLEALETGPPHLMVRAILKAIVDSEPRLAHSLTNLPLHVRLHALEEAVHAADVALQHIEFEAE